MKKKNDDLLRLAFGELSADAAKSAEAQAAADPAARKELEAYRSLRVGLQQLPPPPPDGLSTERLRAAILDRELKTRRPMFAPLAWAPMALAAVAAVVFFARPAAPSDPTILANNAEPDYKRLIKTPEFKTPPAMAVAAKQGEKKNVVPPPVERVASNSAQDETSVRPAVDRGERSRRSNTTTTKVGWSGSKRATAEEGKQPEYVLNPTPDTVAPPSSIVSPGGAGRIATNSDDTVVIISTQRDLETGANAASETEAGNVLVGG